MLPSKPRSQISVHKRFFFQVLPGQKMESKSGEKIIFESVNVARRQLVSHYWTLVVTNNGRGANDVKMFCCLSFIAAWSRRKMARKRKRYEMNGFVAIWLLALAKRTCKCTKVFNMSLLPSPLDRALFQLYLLLWLTSWTASKSCFIPQLEGDVLLVCVGRRPYTTRLGLEVSLLVM